MNFGDILAEWEKDAGNKALYEAHNRDSAQSNKKNNAGERRARLLRKKPDAVIDLHGLKQDEAWKALELFFDDSKQKGFEKILVIHGKGSHSLPLMEPKAGAAGFNGSEGVLKDLARKFIEACSFAGESGYSSNRDGGSGSTWVILKGSSRQFNAG